MRGLPYILLFILALSACKDSTRFVQRLDDIDSLIDVAPDSAYNQLMRMHDEVDNQRKSIRMRYELTLAKAQNKNFVTFTTDSVMKQVVEYYDDNGTPSQQMYANYLLGCTYRDLGDAPTELEYFQKAVESADTTAEDCDFYTLAAVYGQMANIYHAQYLPIEEFNAIRMYEKYSWQIEDTLSAINGIELRCRPYHLMGKEDSAAITTHIAEELYTKYGYKKQAATCAFTRMAYMIENNNLIGARPLLERFEKESGLLNDKGEIQSGYEIYYYYKGLYAMKSGLLKEAIACYHKLIGSPNTADGYKGLLNTYQSLAESDSINKYASLYAEAVDSLYASKQSEQVSQLTSLYNYSRHQEIAQKEHKGRIENLKWLIFTICLVAVLCVFIAIIVTYSNSRRKAIKMEHQHILDEMERIHNEVKQIDENRIEELLCEKKALIKEYESKLSKWTELNNGELFPENTKVIESPIYIRLKNLASKGKKASNEDIENLQELIDSIYPDFRIKSNALTTLRQEENYICALTKLHFSPSDISVLLEYTPASISMTRKRLHKKIFGTEGTGKDFDAKVRRM